MSQANEKPKILVVDDSVTDIEILHDALKKDYQVYAATSGEEGLRRMAATPPDLILLDVVMPGMSGYDVCLKLKADPATTHIPVIFITGRGEEKDETEAFKLGAADYITKPYNLVVVLARVNSVLRLKKEMDMRRDLAAELKHLNDQLETKVEEQVSQLRQAHDEVKESEALLSVVLENINDPVFITDDDDVFTYVCPNAPRVLGYSMEEFQAMGKVFSLVSDSLFTPEELAAKGEIHNIETTLADKDGRRRSYLITIKRVAIKKGTILWTCRDIDERKKLETRLRQAYKMEAIGTLAGGIAHDFNNILAAILGYAEISRSSVDQDSDLFRNLSHVLAAGGRAKELIKQILMFSRESEEELRPIRISLPVKEAMRLIRASLPATIEVRSRIQSDQAVLADPTQMLQVVMNLCTNAAQAMGTSGGILSVSLTDAAVSVDQPQDHPDLVPGAYVKLTVADTGSGIPPHLVDRIFDPFFTTKDKGEGTGMGLAVVHGIIKNCEGAINVTSHPGEGTVFEIWLPTRKGLALDTEKLKTPLPGGSETILLVDDETMITDIIRVMLTSLGYEVVARNHSLEAWEAFKQTPERFDLLLTDMTMPKMTGLDLAEKIHQLRPELPVILCTGFDTPIDEEVTARLNIRGTILKPILKRDLAEVVRKALDED